MTDAPASRGTAYGSFKDGWTRSTTATRSPWSGSTDIDLRETRMMGFTRFPFRRRAIAVAIAAAAALVGTAGAIVTTTAP
jgi:hypothetical protein